MNRSDIVLIPDSEGPKNTTWRKVLAMVLLFAFVIALVVTLILLFIKDESHNNTPKGNTTQIQTTSNTFLELNHTTGLVEDECKRSSSGYDYTGKVSVTQSGRTCQAWNSQTPHSHTDTSLQENYCRNPGGRTTPWCYTTDPNKHREICNIPYCVTCPLECIRKNDPIGRKYFGTINVTETGEPCQRWDSQTPHAHRFAVLADQENYCRNSIDGTGPWCYTTNAYSRWGYCTISHC